MFSFCPRLLHGATLPWPRLSRTLLARRLPTAACPCTAQSTVTMASTKPTPLACPHPDCAGLLKRYAAQHALDQHTLTKHGATATHTAAATGGKGKKKNKTKQNITALMLGGVTSSNARPSASLLGTGGRTDARADARTTPGRVPARTININSKGPSPPQTMPWAQRQHTASPVTAPSRLPSSRQPSSSSSSHRSSPTTHQHEFRRQTHHVQSRQAVKRNTLEETARKIRFDVAESGCEVTFDIVVG